MITIPSFLSGRKRVFALGLAMLLAFSGATANERALLAAKPMDMPASSDTWPAWSDDRQALTVSFNAFAQGGTLHAELLPGEVYQLATGEVENRGGDRLTWRGQILQGERSVGSATLTFDSQRVRGMLMIRGIEYRLSTDQGGHQWLDRLDADARPSIHPEGAPFVPQADMEAMAQEPAAINSGEEAPVVDVIVFYTEGAMGDYDDEADMRLAIQNAVDINNTAFINSEVDGRVRLVAQFPWDWEDTGSGQDALSASRTNSDIQALQDKYAADLVAVITSDTNVCGVAYLLTFYTDSWGSGYSMTSSTPYCLGGQTFAHELGHNMGLHHDPGNVSQDPGDLIEPFAFGFFEDWEFRTIMSYWNQCPGDSGWEQYNEGCPQIDHFSDPDINAPGSGLPTGTADNNNAEVLRQVMPYVAQWYDQPSSLAVASGEPTNVLESGGDSLWVAQDQILWEEGDTALLSGPAHGDEQSWLALSDLGDDNLDISFQLRATVADSQGVLTVYADGSEIGQFDAIPDDWVNHSVNAPASTGEVRWVWTASAGADPESVGMVAMTGMERDDLAETTYYGVVKNAHDQTVNNVTVSARNSEGNDLPGSAESGSSGAFELTVGHPEDAPPSDLVLSGHAVQSTQHSLSENSCEEESTPCELTTLGEPRTLSGQVSGMLDGESVFVSAGFGAQETVTADTSGVAEFSLSGEAVVHYGPLTVEATGYAMSSSPIDSIDVRDDDAVGLDVTLSTQAPTIASVETTDNSGSSVTVAVSVSVFERDSTVSLTQGSGEDATELEQTILASDGEETVTFQLSGLECGNSYDIDVEVVNDHDQSAATTDSVSTTECSDSGSGSSCSLSPGARPDPLLGMLLLLAFLGLVRRRQGRAL